MNQEKPKSDNSIIIILILLCVSIIGVMAVGIIESFERINLSYTSGGVMLPLTAAMGTLYYMWRRRRG